MLCYGKMVKTHFTLREVGAIFPKLNTIKKASAVANTLKRKGYLVKHETEECWQVTSNGIDVIYKIARKSGNDLNSND